MQYLGLRLMILAIFLFGALWSQEPVHYWYGAAAGVPHAGIESIAQDERGFLWISSRQGLFRFNGRYFEPRLRTDDFEARIGALQGEANGRIWFADDLGMVCYVERDTIKKFEAWLPSWGKPQFALDEERKRLWLSSTQKTRVYDLAPEANLKLLASFEGGGDNAHVSGGYFYVVERGGLSIFSLTQGMARLEYVAIPELQNRVLWFTYQKMTYFYDPSQDLVYKIMPFGPIAYQRLECRPEEEIYQIKSWGKHLMVASSYGLALRLAGEKNPEEWQLSPHQFFYTSKVFCIFQDKDGNYWLGVEEKGLLFIPSFEFLEYNSRTHASLQGQMNALWSQDETKAPFVLMDNGNLVSLARTGQNYISPNKELKKMGLGPEGYVWLWGKELALMRLEQAKTYKALAYPTEQIKALDWSPQGGYFYLAEENRFGRLKLSETGPPQYELILPQGVNHFVFKDFFLWLNTKQGLALYHEPTKKLQYLKQGNKNLVANCLSRAEDIVFVGTKTGEILLYQFDGNFVNKNVSDTFILSNFGGPIEHLHYDKEEGYLWAFVNKTLYRIAFKGPDFERQAFGFLDGLPLYYIKDIKTNKHFVWLVTNTEVISFSKAYARSPRSLRNSFRIYFQGLQLSKNGPLLEPQRPNYYQLSEAQNLFIKLDIAAYNSRGDFKLEYALKDASQLLEESDYLQTNEAPLEIPAANLAPGTYRIHLRYPKAFEAEDQEVITEIFFFIPTPLYKTPWFFLVSLGFFIGISYIIYYMWKKNDRLEKERQRLSRDLESSNIASIRAQMNPHFIFNALNTIQNYIYKNDSQTAVYFLGKFSDLMRQILIMSSNEYISLDEEIKTLSTYIELENMRFEQSIRVHFEIDPALNTEDIQIPPMVIQPYVENAIKHGLLHKTGLRTLQLHFKLSEDDQALFVRIEDNGIGRDKAKALQKTHKNSTAYQSYSSEANARRLKLLGQHLKLSRPIDVNTQDVCDEQGLVQGTRVEFLIPIFE